MPTCHVLYHVIVWMKKSHVINQPKVIGMCNDYIDTCFCKSLDLYSIVRDLKGKSSPESP